MSKLSRKIYSETFKLEVLRDYFSSGMSMISTAKKWGLTSHTYILRWLKCYPIDSDLLSLSPELLSELQMKRIQNLKKNFLKRKICVFERRWNLKSSVPMLSRN